MNLSNISKQIIMTTIALSFIAFGIGAFMSKNITNFGIGLLFGTIFSILKLILLEKTLDKAVGMTSAKAVNYTRIHYTLRYFLTFLVLLVAVYKKFDIIAVIVGIILPVPAIYIVNFKNKNK